MGKLYQQKSIECKNYLKMVIYVISYHIKIKIFPGTIFQKARET